MNKDFPRIITLLRKEKSLSQKQVSADLGISQALLSHYEKGIRECSLDFIVKVADYYDVSCDYLLGRTPQRNNEGYDKTVFPDSRDKIREAGEKEVTNVMSAVNRKIITNSIYVIFKILAQINSRTLTKAVSNYLFVCVYKIFRKIYSSNEKNKQNLFGVNKNTYQGFCASAMELSYTKISNLTNPHCKESYIKRLSEYRLSTDILVENYPQYASSLINLIQYAENNMNFK